MACILLNIENEIVLILADTVLDNSSTYFPGGLFNVVDHYHC